MDTLGPIISVLIIKVTSYFIIKVAFGNITKCVDYAALLISSVLINKYHCIVEWITV